MPIGSIASHRIPYKDVLQNTKPASSLPIRKVYKPRRLASEFSTTHPLFCALLFQHLDNMSNSTQSPTFGSSTGTSFNDMSGKWENVMTCLTRSLFDVILATGPNIDKISKIIVNHGEVVDGLTITYATPGGPKTETHGGQTGNVATITLSGGVLSPVRAAGNQITAFALLL